MTKAKKSTEPAVVEAHDPSSLPGKLRSIGGSKSDTWNNVLANQAIQTIWGENSDQEGQFSDLSKILTLGFGSWAIPKFFDRYESLIWSLSDQNRVGLEGLSYFVFFCLIILTVSNSLDRARAEGRDAEIASSQTRPLRNST